MSSRTEPQRLFFALFPPARVCRAISKLQGRLDFEARPVAAKQFHITLAFLGDQPVSRLGSLRKLAARIRIPAGDLYLDHVACFSRARVAYLGASEPPDALRSFRQALAEALAEAGFALEHQPWKPHVTLYRKMRKPCARIPVKPVQWPVDSYCLVSSRLEKTGAEYRPLWHWESRG